MLIRSAAALLATTLLLPRPCHASPRDRLLVSPTWLKAHLTDPNLVLLQIGDRSQYDREHIPGARYLDFHSISDRSTSGLMLELPPVSRLDSNFAALGVTRESRIVLYFGSDWLSPTTRAWLTLEYLGLGENTAILDGGLPAWKAAGHPVTSDAPAPVTPRPLASTAHPEIVTDAEWVHARLGQPRFRVIDARDAEFYQGLDAGSGTRAGHLPGARNIPFTSVTDTLGRFLPDSALSRLFRQAGVSRGDQVVAYCHIGQQATAVVFAARLLGYDVRLYDGSWQDWSRRREYAVEGEVPSTRGALISTEELARRIEGNDVTVIDLRSDLNAYLADHLPNAVYLHYETLRAAANGVPGDVIPAASYAEIWSRIGIRRDRPVVIYASGDAQNFNATFLVWLLAGFRQPEVYLLDGGYAKWTAEKRPLTRLYPEVAAVAYKADPYRLDRVEGQHVQHMLGNPGVVLVDVRPPDQFAGTAGAQVRRGHIPGAINHPWHDDLATAGGVATWKSVDELRAAYAAQGITPDKYVIIYCNTGTEASHAYFALHFLLGYPDVRVYVPSWTEWSEHTDWPVDGPATTPVTSQTATPAKNCSEH
jgi:thiosulfate/3-mercaptopyruvate sulfurtransferase